MEKRLHSDRRQKKFTAAKSFASKQTIGPATPRRLIVIFRTNQPI